MQSFKQYLTEAKIDFAPWHGTDPIVVKNELAKRYLKQFGWTDETLDEPRGQIKIEDELKNQFKSWSFNKNGTVTLRGTDIRIYKRFLLATPEGTKIPFQIQSANEVKFISDNLVSVWGAPLKCKVLNIYSEKLESLEHLNTTCERLVLKTPALKEFNCNVKANGLFIEALGMKTLTGIQKNVELSHYIGFYLHPKNIDNIKIESNILGLFQIKGGLNKVSCSYGPTAPENKTPLMKALEIVDKHFHSDKDIMDCREELVQEGLKEFARM